ncbi:MAG: hypothetical protein GXP49_12260 [Deltaproteobacteria bacterium]|nr:hypothetical protein [Deltaproteobacteria bacterium]
MADIIAGVALLSGCAASRFNDEGLRHNQERSEIGLRDRILAGERRALEQAISMLASPEESKREAAQEVLLQVADEYGPYLRAAVRRRNATTPGIIRILALAGGERNIAHLKRLAGEKAFASMAKDALEVAEQQTFDRAGYDIKRLELYKRFFPDGRYIAEVDKRLDIVKDPGIWGQDPVLSERLKVALSHISDISESWSNERQNLSRELLSKANDSIEAKDLRLAKKWIALALLLNPSAKQRVGAAWLTLAEADASAGRLNRALDDIDRAMENAPGLERHAESLRENIFQHKPQKDAVYEFRIVEVELRYSRKGRRRRGRRKARIKITVRAGKKEVSADAMASGKMAKWKDGPLLRVRNDERLAISVRDDGKTMGEFGPAQVPISGMQGEAELEFDRVKKLVLEYRRVR